MPALGFLCLSGETNDVCRKVLQILTDIALTKKDEPYMQPSNTLGILPLRSFTKRSCCEE